MTGLRSGAVTRKTRAVRTPRSPRASIVLATGMTPHEQTGRTAATMNELTTPLGVNRFHRDVSSPETRLASRKTGTTVAV